MKLLFSNLGYATGISGSLFHHITKAFRHVYQPPAMQRAVLKQFRQIIETERPDVCCLVELDQGSIHSGHFNQIHALMCEDYAVYDIADKYGTDSLISRMPFHAGKSNAFLARQAFDYGFLYFTHGTKRLIYRLTLREGLTLFFTHFSLKKEVRARQFVEIRRFAEATDGAVIILADFNIFEGLSELEPLIGDGFLRLLNRPEEATFSFHRWRHLLDLCLYSPSLESEIGLRIISQPFSDHSALLVTLETP